MLTAVKEAPQSTYTVKCNNDWEGEPWSSVRGGQYSRLCWEYLGKSFFSGSCLCWSSHRWDNEDSLGHRGTQQDQGSLGGCQPLCAVLKNSGTRWNHHGEGVQRPRWWLYSIRRNFLRASNGLRKVHLHYWACIFQDTCLYLPRSKNESLVSLHC